eukprot:m.157493 g.157493  ORF g.157493 m.157493 type:complete len:154 (+) comp10231_c1_seq2:129-590(+)
MASAEERGTVRRLLHLKEQLDLALDKSDMAVAADILSELTQIAMNIELMRVRARVHCRCWNAWFVSVCARLTWCRVHGGRLRALQRVSGHYERKLVISIQLSATVPRCSASNGKKCCASRSVPSLRQQQRLQRRLLQQPQRRRCLSLLLRRLV